MANRNSNTKATKGAISNMDFGSVHARFSWFPDDMKHNTEAQRAGRMVDLTRGTRVIASILRQHLVDLDAIAGGAGESVTPLLNPSDTQDLVGLMEASLDALCDMAAHVQESLANPVAGGMKA